MNKYSVFFFLVFFTLSVSPAAGKQGTAATPVFRSLEDRLRDVENEHQYLKQALKDSQEETRILLGGFAALMVLVQVISSIFQARREDRVYEKQVRREDELEKRRTAHEKELEIARQSREDVLDRRHLQREQQQFNFWSERDKQLEQRRIDHENRLDDLTESSVKSVNDILGVVRNTFEERRKAEEEGREAAKNFNDRIKELNDTIQ
jgi:hypothetical protein